MSLLWRVPLFVIVFLFFTAYGTALLFSFWYMEMSGVFGRSVLRDELRPDWWTTVGLSHPATFIVQGDQGPRLDLPMQSGISWDDPAVLGEIELVASWSRTDLAIAEPDSALRRVGVSIIERSPLNSGDKARVTREFLTLQRQWGNTDLANQAQRQTPVDVVHVRRVIDWERALARLRGHAILWGFVASFLISVVQALSYLVVVTTRVRPIDDRQTRLLAGLCPECEYPKRGLAAPVCPECGGTW